MDTSNVEDVFIAGKVMKWQGKMVGVDVNRIIQSANKSVEGLIARTNYVNSPFDTCCPGPLLAGADRGKVPLDKVKRGS
jgi:hypothetical protein